MASCRSEEKNRQITTRLNRVEGQIRGIKNMVEEDRDCMDILHQILSAASALRSIWEIVAAAHIQGCIEDYDKDERNKNIEEIITHMKELR